MDYKKLSWLSGKTFGTVFGFTLFLTPTDFNVLSLRAKFWFLVQRQALDSGKLTRDIWTGLMRQKEAIGNFMLFFSVMGNKYRL